MQTYCRQWQTLARLPACIEDPARVAGFTTYTEVSFLIAPSTCPCTNWRCSSLDSPSTTIKSIHDYCISRILYAAIEEQLYSRRLNYRHVTSDIISNTVNLPTLLVPIGTLLPDMQKIVHPLMLIQAQQINLGGPPRVGIAIHAFVHRLIISPLDLFQTQTESERDGT